MDRKFEQAEQKWLEAPEPEQCSECLELIKDCECCGDCFNRTDFCICGDDEEE